MPLTTLTETATEITTETSYVPTTTTEISVSTSVRNIPTRVITINTMTRTQTVVTRIVTRPTVTEAVTTTVTEKAGAQPVMFGVAATPYSLDLLGMFIAFIVVISIVVSPKFSRRRHDESRKPT